MGKCIIVCAGEFKDTEIVRAAGDCLIAVDGGYHYCRQQGREPDLLVGDFDSAAGGELAEIMHIRETSPDKVVQLPKEKDDTDTLAAIRIGLAAGYRSFVFYGATGGRLDHTLANIQCLIYLKNHGASGFLIASGEILTVIRDETIILSPEGARRIFEGHIFDGRMSLFSLSARSEGVTITGMKYPLDRVTVTNDYPIGVSNEFLPRSSAEERMLNPPAVSVEKGTLLLILDESDR